MKQTFVLPPDKRDASIERVARFLRDCIPGKPVRVTVERHVKRRSTEQNSYLWGVVYPTLIRESGAQWSDADLHELLLGECFGWEVIDGFGRKRKRPLKRSSALTTMEFSDYVAFIQHFAAEHGVYVPDPNEQAA